jgi:hypothetical protein
MRIQLGNDQVLNAYFLSSLVGYSAKLTRVVIVPRNTLSKCFFGFARHLPRKPREFVQLGEITFKMTFIMQKHLSHCNLISKAGVPIPLPSVRDSPQNWIHVWLLLSIMLVNLYSALLVSAAAIRDFDRRLRRKLRKIGYPSPLWTCLAVTSSNKFNESRRTALWRSLNDRKFGTWTHPHSRISFR